MIPFEDKIRGMFLGVAIGDSLGMPVESWSRDRIKESYPDIREYKKPSGHKWYSDQPAGSWTDDTMLTIATARAIIDSGSFNLKSQANASIKAMQEAMKSGTTSGSGVPGWGYTTVNAVRNLSNNIHWSESGKTQDESLGHGNGVVMRQSPIAAWFFKNPDPSSYQMLVDFSSMTHYTKQSAIAAVVHNSVLMYCLKNDEFNRNVILSLIHSMRHWRRSQFEPFYRYSYCIDHLRDTQINIWDQFDKLKLAFEWDVDRIVEEFGGGSCNVAHSLPFCYAFFVKNSDLSVEVLYEIVQAGGDTDTNASIVGSMLGALYGSRIFPEHLVDGLIGKDEIFKLADDFCQIF